MPKFTEFIILNYKLMTLMLQNLCARPFYRAIRKNTFTKWVFLAVWVFLFVCGFVVFVGSFFFLFFFSVFFFRQFIVLRLQNISCGIQ